MRRLAFILLLILTAIPLHAQQPLPLGAQSYPRADNVGITFISFAEGVNRDENTRYQHALALGAGWHRFPVYWNSIETAPGNYYWALYDGIIGGTLRAGLRVDAVLISTPDFYRGGGEGGNLFASVFSDGTDDPAPGKTINPNNMWAQFVYATVSRYRPGSEFARANGGGVTVWEIWNEPDLPQFWQGSRVEYARLLKVGYLATKYADPSAQVMFGALAYADPDTENWLDSVLAVYAQDPNAARNNWYMDLVGVHSYSNPRRTYLVVNSAQESLAAVGISRPIWHNEMGAPVWNDYPGHTWSGNDPSVRRYRVTMEQQAAYAIQAPAYAFAAGADKVFWHAMYDDCGDAPGNHAPDTFGVAGDAFGLYRNTRENTCYNQHPQPGTPRPAADAYRAMANILGDGDFSDGQVFTRGDGTTFIVLIRPGERITVMWNDLPRDVTTRWGAQTANAMVYGYGDLSFPITPINGEYVVTLPAAPSIDAASLVGTLVGGTTFMMVEQGNFSTSLAASAPDELVVIAPQLVPVVTPRVPLPGQIGSILGDGAPASNSFGTLADLTPPITGIEALPAISPLTFSVRWNASDTGGIARYIVWVRADGGEWLTWLDTTDTQADYSGQAGSTYEFAVWAADAAGNWSLNTNLRAQAMTTVQAIGGGGG
jgi:hypothetical protein